MSIGGCFGEFIGDLYGDLGLTQNLQMLCQGMSMRAISRVADVYINTVTKLLEDAGKFCFPFHRERARAHVQRPVATAMRIQTETVP